MMKPTIWTEERVVEVTRLRHNGLSWTEIANRLGGSATSVRDAMFRQARKRANERDDGTPWPKQTMTPEEYVERLIADRGLKVLREIEKPSGACVVAAVDRDGYALVHALRVILKAAA